MNKLKTMLCAVFTLLLVNTTASADSSNFAGPYVGITGSGYGLQMDGSATQESDTTGPTVTDDVSLGQVAPVTGIEVGYALPLGDMVLVDVGASYYSGEATISHFGDDNGENQGGADVSFKVDDLVTYYIAPTIALSDTSSLYVKVGVSEADTGVTGDVTSPGNLSGTTWAMGTRTVLDSGIFIRTEAGYTDYNGISAHGKGTTVSAANSYSAEPTIAFGAVSFGFRF